MDLEESRKLHLFSGYIWDSNLKALWVFNLYVKEWILALACLPHDLYTFYKGQSRSGVDVQHSVHREDEDSVLFLSKMGLWEQLLWMKGHMNQCMWYLASAIAGLIGDYQKPLQIPSPPFFLSWHLLYFHRWYSIKNNGVTLYSPKWLIIQGVFSASIIELELGFWFWVSELKANVEIRPVSLLYRRERRTLRSTGACWRSQFTHSTCTRSWVSPFPTECFISINTVIYITTLWAVSWTMVYALNI